MSQKSFIGGAFLVARSRWLEYESALPMRAHLAGLFYFVVAFCETAKKSLRLQRPVPRRIELKLSPQPSVTPACPTFYEKPLLVKLNLRRKRLTRRGFGGGAPKSLPEAAWLHGWRIDHSSIRALPLQSGMPMWVFRYGSAPAALSPVELRSPWLVRARRHESRSIFQTSFYKRPRCVDWPQPLSFIFQRLLQVQPIQSDFSSRDEAFSPSGCRPRRRSHSSACHDPLSPGPTTASACWCGSGDAPPARASSAAAYCIRRSLPRRRSYCRWRRCMGSIRNSGTTAWRS